MTTVRVFFAATLVAALAVTPIKGLAQPDFQEAPIIEIAGVRYSTLITVNFSVPVITGIGQRAVVDVSDFHASFNDLINYFNDLESEYGSYEMGKVFPGADWGENVGLRAVQRP